MNFKRNSANSYINKYENIHLKYIPKIIPLKKKLKEKKAELHRINKTNIPIFEIDYNHKLNNN